jgi:hypothetical protein
LVKIIKTFINHFFRHFEHWMPVLFILINLHIGTNKKCSRNQWGMSIERSIIYYFLPQ